jgi:membrane protein YdbS with pleckstrin-like domain
MQVKYENPVIPPDDIPRYEDVPLQPVEPAFRKVQYIGWAFGYGLTMAAIVLLYLYVDALHSRKFIGAALLVWLAAVALTVAAIEVGFRYRAWALRERDIVFRSGWLFRTTHIIPFVKVQHCVLWSGPVERMFGLASIGLMTAASSEFDIRIRGLKRETAERLKQWIVGKAAADGHPGV